MNSGKREITELPCRIVGMSNEEYRGLSEFHSRSYLHSVGKYGGEAQRWMDRGRSLWGGNSATAKGSEFDAIITGTLEGKKFDDMVAVAPEEVLGSNGTRNTKAFKEWAAQQTGIVLTAEQKHIYSLMYDEMLGNDASYSLMQRTTGTQASIFFEIEGHRCKVRPDAEIEGICWWDLKTTSSTWDRIYRSAIDYGYAEQAWLYTQGAKAIGYPDFQMPFVFVQTMPPYSCRVYTLPDEMVANAGRRLLSVMEQVSLRRSTGMYFPAEHGVITELEVPGWAIKQEEEVVV